MIVCVGTSHVVAEEATAVKEPDAKAKAKPLKTVDVKMAEGLLKAKLPEAWKQKKVRSPIIELEWAVAPVKGDENPGRLTAMASGGTIKMNVDRWIGQFTQPDGKKTSEVAKISEKKLNEMRVTIVDISGNFKESIGPPRLRKSVERKDYRMLAARVQAKPFGNRAYFIKLYGPQKTMAAAEKPFMAMIDSLQMKSAETKGSGEATTKEQ